MGYSISVHCRSAKARDEMMSFLKQHYRPWSKIRNLKDDGMDWTEWLMSGKLAYDYSPLNIGYNYSTQHCQEGMVGNYGYTILRWIALKVGQLKKFPEWDLHDKCPFTVYDGDEKWPVIVKKENTVLYNERATQFLTDEFGYRPLEQWSSANGCQSWPVRVILALSGQLKFEKLVNETSKEEVRRLDKLWEKRNG